MAQPPAEAREAAPDTSEDKRHFCVVTETFPPEVNGVALTLSHLVRGLGARGHRVSVVKPRQRKFDAKSCNAHVTEVAGLPLPGYKGLQFGLPSGGLLQQVWMRQRPDAVYVATEGPLGLSAVRVARRLSIPVFSGFHTNFHSYSRHYGVAWLEGLVLWYLRRFHNRTRGTLVPSAELRDRLHARGFKNVAFVGRGVDSELFDPQRRRAELRNEWGVGENEIALLYVGRLAGEKNIRLAVDAYRASKRLCANLKFVIVGDGPLRQSLKTENPDLVFCGMQTGERLAEHYASADVFLFPSETETFGNVTLEAMASGLAVVAYDYAAAGWHVVHGETGVLVPFGDSKMFVESAVGLVRQEDRVHQIRAKARAYAASISWARVVERFETLLMGQGERRKDSINPLVRRQGLAAAKGRM